MASTGKTYDSLFFSSTSFASSQSVSVGLFSSISINQVVSVKLTHDNYLLWKAQMMSYLRGQRRLQFADGSYVYPPAIRTVTSASGSTKVANSDHICGVNKINRSCYFIFYVRRDLGVCYARDNNAWSVDCFGKHVL